MKKLMILSIFALLFAGCSTSPYVGTWEKVGTDGKTYNLKLNDDGSLIAKWYYGSEQIVRTGTWEEDGEGGVRLDGINTFATAKLTQDRLLLNTKKQVRHHFTRRVARHAHKH